MGGNMGTISKTVCIAASARLAWDAVTDVGELHVRVAPGMVTDTKLEDAGAVRVVTFSSGVMLREQIISNDPATMRLCWTASGGPWTHHNASLQITGHRDGCDVTWTADVLPHDAVTVIAPFIEAGLATFKSHLESGGSPPPIADMP
jgi:Polyketide cyclase / dehydrase and lipid transport